MQAQTIIEDNELPNPDQLVTGQTLILMTDVIPHIVTRGQSLYAIANAYGVALSDLQTANPQLSNPERLQVGDVVNVPVPTIKRGIIDVNGYCFPTIDRGVLNKTLPHLTYLSIFSYEVRPDGSLSSINDTPLIEAARQQSVAPLMVITNLEEGAGFSSELANTILTDAGVRQNLIDNVIGTLSSKNYYGLDIDFEYIFPEDGDAYDRLLREMTQRLHALGYIVTTSIAPKTSAGQRGLLYEAHHYPIHGQLVDHVIIMTYEWGYTYGPAMAVAPVDQVRRVLDYAVTAIPSEKILMGMPNYGYDWTLPFRQGTAARTISNAEAVNLALRRGASINYNTVSQAPFFNYTDSNVRHEVWFDDARSIRARLRLVDEYDLGGVSYWTVNRYFPQNWLILESMYDTRKAL
jgi:spore germination protein